MRRWVKVPRFALAQIAIALSVSCGGESTQDGVSGAGAGGSSGTSGTGAGGSGMNACNRDDAGRLPLEAKACLTDDDCIAVPTYSCCGPGTIVGLTKSAPQYRSCFQTSYPQNCPPLGCASRAQTEDGQYPPIEPPDLTGVVARCVVSDGDVAVCATRYEPDAGIVDAASDR